MWWIYALLSALFASLTAIFAKIGVTHVNSNLATAIRTVIILLVAWGIVFFRGEYKSLHTLSKHNLFFLVISGLATGLSWIFYFKALQVGKVSQVAPVDKLSVALQFSYCIPGSNQLKSPSVPYIIAGTIVLIITPILLPLHITSAFLSLSK
jgi:transporter family protein